ILVAVIRHTRADALRPGQGVHRPTGLGHPTVVAQVGVSNERASRRATATRRYPDGAETVVDDCGHAAGDRGAVIITGVDGPAVEGGVAREIRPRNLVDVGMIGLDAHIEDHHYNVR